MKYYKHERRKITHMLPSSSVNMFFSDYVKRSMGKATVYSINKMAHATNGMRPSSEPHSTGYRR